MKHEDIISKLTVEQKCALLVGQTAFGTRAIPSVGLPSLEFSDGPNGLRHQGQGANHLGLGGSDPSTCFPTAVVMADSWDPAMVEQIGEALGEEAAAVGVNVLLGPGMCIKRSPLCGRDFEYFSEDPYLAGKIATGYVKGVQSKGIGTSVKHFAVNSQETRRQASDSVLDERALREIYTAAFEIVVKEAQPKTVMSSYNLVNGTYANDNEYLLTDLLRKEWGFQGAVVTDWGGSNDHVAGVKAGSNFEMPAPGLDSTRELLAALKKGTLDEATLNQRVDEAVDLILSTHDAVANSDGTFDIEGHHQVARKAAAAGAVLLKNDSVQGGKALLPLNTKERVALIGDFAKTPRFQGAGSSLVNATKTESLLDVVQASDLNFVGYEPGFEREGGENEEKAQAALDLAKHADVLVVCLGLSEAAESEGLDRSTMEIAPNQVELLHRLAQVNKNIVVLLISGSVVQTDWSADAESILYLGLGGQAGASAALDLIMGKVNPSGKLAETWAKSLRDTPTFGNYPSDDFAAEYRESIYVGYRYYQKAGMPVAYPFGYGLSYTTFGYSNLSVAPDGSSVSFDLTNTGGVAGAEVAQVYVGKPDAKVFGPVRQLKGFTKVLLEPGQTEHITIALNRRAYSYFNVKTHAWEIEGGTYTIEVGGSSVELPLSAQVSVTGTGAPNPYEGLELPSYVSGHVQQISDKEFSTLLGHELPEHKVVLDRNLCFRDLLHGRSPIFWIVGLVLGVLVKQHDANGRPNLNALFIYNMPLRALSKNAGQFFSMGMVDALVREVKGWGLIGLIPAIIVKVLTGKHFLSIWFLWFILPILIEFVINLVRNAQGEKLLAQQGNK